MVKDIKSYEPSKIGTKVLRDDWRIACAWYSSLRHGKKVKHSREDIENLAQLIVEELLKRKTTEFHVDTMETYARELFLRVMRRIRTGKLEQENLIVQSSGNLRGDPVYLEEVVNCLDAPFRIASPFVYLIGGLCNHGASAGDIDILLRKDEPVTKCNKCGAELKDNDEDMAIKFRILRALPKEMWDRVQFIYDNNHGPFTNHVPLFDLALVPSSRRELVTMAAKNAEGDESRRLDKIQPFRFFYMPKPKKGVVKKELYSVEAVKAEMMKQDPDWKTWEVDEKFDGFRAQIHKAGNKVQIITEDGGDVTGRFPDFVKAALDCDVDFIIDTEITGEENGKHMGRSDVSGYIHSKGKADDSPFTANVHDVVWFKGMDIHRNPRHSRLQTLTQLRTRLTGKQFKFLTWKTQDSEAGFDSNFKWAISVPGSEGAMMKDLNKPYELDMAIGSWVKYKNELQVVAEIKEVFEVSKASWNYLCTIGKGIPIGKTYNTPMFAKKGDRLKVALGNLNKYKTPEGRAFYNWVFPRVLDKTTDAVTTELEADRVVQESGGFVQNAPWPKRYENLSAGRPFVVQHHYRGRTAHADMRFDFGDHLEGFTLADMEANEITSPVETLAEAKHADSVEKWKVDWNTGEEQKRTGGIQKIFAVPKGNQPKVWLGVEGVVSPGDAGATKEFPGVFSKIQHGTYELGAQKANFREFFMHGQGNFKGRIVFRLLGRSGKWADVGKESFVWFYWKPDDQTPYVLERAITKAWVPEGDISAMPAEWESKIPPELRWWGKKLPAEAKLKMMKEARKLLLKSGQIGAKLSEAKFVLQRHWWKGATVVRGMPVEHFDLRLDVPGRAGLEHYVLDGNPLFLSNNINALRKPCADKGWMTKEGDIPPGQEGNPNKDIPAHVEILDSGTVNLINDTENYVSLTFYGRKLKGYWILKGEGNQLVMEKSSLPVPKLGSLEENAIEALCEAGSRRINLEIKALC